MRNFNTAGFLFKQGNLLVFICLVFSSCTHAHQVVLVEDAVDTSAGDLPCYRIETPAATYYLEKEGAGLSSMIDTEGIDWIGFHPDKGTGAGGEFRGFPNAIYKQDGSFFHAKNSGTEPSDIEVVRNSGDLVELKAVSGNGNWEAIWSFYPTHCTFTMTKMAEGYNYWVLYEGVPGGSYDSTDWYMTSAIQEKVPLTVFHESDIPDPEWIAFGDKDVDRCLVLFHHEDDDKMDRYYQLREKMTVFGFGRNGRELLMDQVPQRFSIGFAESTGHHIVSDFVNRIAME